MNDFVSKLNLWGRERTPFLFVIDFEMVKPYACRIEDCAGENVWFDVRGVSNTGQAKKQESFQMERFPVSFEEYEKKFNTVMARLQYGDSFLTNLTIRTEIKVGKTLAELMDQSRAKYRLLFKDQFLVFSPETFIRIEHGKLFANPMKGTIRASVPAAEQTLRNDQKELAEHVTIVDLLRNDISQVAHDVHVSRFRYAETLNTMRENLLQMSSEITGNLPADYHETIGALLFSLLPAGSVSGAPKPKTLDIIRKAEGEPRGYYTGVFGYFNGTDLDSGVMIRYIEKEGNVLFYRSGGGITTNSNARREYEEAIDKIYVPVD